MMSLLVYFTNVLACYYLIYRILYHCHHVMLRQLSSWLLYGNFIDPHNEFFIQESKEVHSTESTCKTGSLQESIYTVSILSIMRQYMFIFRCYYK